MIRTLGRTLLLSSVAVLALQGSAAQEGTAAEREQETVRIRNFQARRKAHLGNIPDFQKKLNETIDYDLPVDTTLDKALDGLLTQVGIPWAVNDAAFGPDNKDVVKKTPVEKIDKLRGMTRATILKKLLAKIPNDSGKTTPTSILRPDRLEITTRDAMMQEFYPGRLFFSHLPVVGLRRL